MEEFKQQEPQYLLRRSFTTAAAATAGTAAAATARTARTTALCSLEGCLLRSSCTFPYYFLLAMEAGSIMRALLLLLCYPLVTLLNSSLISQPLSIQLLIFISVAGLRASTVELVSRAVLLRFFLEDMAEEPYSALLASQRRYVLTSCPRIMVEPFLKGYLQAEQVLGSELHTVSSGLYCTGLVSNGRVMTGAVAAHAAKKLFYDSQPELGIGRAGDAFLELCKEKLYVSPDHKFAKPVPREHYLKPLIFHDGRLAVRPTPAMALTIFLWLPFGACLLVLRVLVLLIFNNIGCILMCEAALGVTLRFRGPYPALTRGSTRGAIASSNSSKNGCLYVCSHRTVLDPVILSGMIFRRVTAVVYSISPLTEFLSPIRTVRLTRRRSEDARLMRGYLDKGDLIVCPEGTTCREPYLLRFSKLFVELTDVVVPVAMQCKVQLFHATSVRGWKAMDAFFFALNPCPNYTVEFLEPVQLGQACRDKDRELRLQDTANMIQARIAKALGFQCTDLTRRDKYRLLANNDGVVGGQTRSLITILKP